MTYKNLAKPVMVDGDALVAIRPTPEADRQFLHVLRDRGIDHEWMMFMISDEEGVSLICPAYLWVGGTFLPCKVTVNFTQPRTPRGSDVGHLITAIRGKALVGSCTARTCI